jgi:MEMO1 family protein
MRQQQAAMPTHSAPTRLPAVAGVFYPGDPEQLRARVEHLLTAERPTLPLARPKALIAPHAGYRYSGPVAASAYARLARVAPAIRRVVILGPAHRVVVRGLAMPNAGVFSTPLGEVEIDRDAVASVQHLPQLTASDAAHAQEHSIEVQLPFLQTVLPHFTLLPLAVGDATAQEVAEVLLALWGTDETLIVVSSDLSHYLPYAQAQRVDRASVDRIVAGIPLDDNQACGASAINGLLSAAAVYALTPRLIDLRNSGDTDGDPGRVVGYAAIEFDASGAERRGRSLLARARHAIASELGLANDTLPADDGTSGATFVTLRHHGELRGCIGSLIAERSLADDVEHNARAAAFRDPRFAPLTRAEFEELRIGVSLLSPPRPLQFASECELLEKLQQLQCGVTIEYGDARSTFLPQVWRDLPTAGEFFAALRAKAGVPPPLAASEIKVSTYSVWHWSEDDEPG